jgi:hypothetical protein
MEDSNPAPVFTSSSQPQEIGEVEQKVEPTIDLSNLFNRASIFDPSISLVGVEKPKNNDLTEQKNYYPFMYGTTMSDEDNKINKIASLVLDGKKLKEIFNLHPEYHYLLIKYINGFQHFSMMRSDQLWERKRKEL